MTKVVEDVENIREILCRSFVNGTASNIRRLAIQAHNFEIKPAIIQMIQHLVKFSGVPKDDLNIHIANFLEICDIFKHNGVLDDVVR